MRKVCCAVRDHSRTKKGQRLVDSTVCVVQSREAGVENGIRPRIR